METTRLQAWTKAVLAAHPEAVIQTARQCGYPPRGSYSVTHYALHPTHPGWTFGYCSAYGESVVYPEAQEDRP